GPGASRRPPTRRTPPGSSSPGPARASTRSWWPRRSAGRACPMASASRPSTTRLSRREHRSTRPHARRSPAWMPPTPGCSRVPTPACSSSECLSSSRSAPLSQRRSPEPSPARPRSRPRSRRRRSWLRTSETSTRSRTPLSSGSARWPLRGATAHSRCRQHWRSEMATMSRSRADETEHGAMHTPVMKPAPRVLRRREIWSRRAPLLPALIFTIVLTQLPFVGTVIVSFMNWNTLFPRDTGFAGVDNYVAVFTDPQLRDAVGFTILLTALVVFASMVIGFGIALLVNEKFLGRGVVRTLLILPFLIVPVAGALFWKHSMLNPSYGLINGVLTSIWRLFGSDSPPQLDILTNSPLLGISMFLVWRWTPFMVLILLAGLQSRKQDVLEAA